jgi:hypothetical protein
VTHAQVGGDFEFLNTVEYLFPLTADDMIHGVVFCDFGTVEQNVSIHRDTFRVAPGAGLRITVPAIPALNSSTGTICFWIKTSGNRARGDYAAILFDRRTSDGDVITLTDDGTIFVQARTNYGNANVFSGSTVVNDNTWHHIAYVYDQSASGSITIYVDGVLDTSNPTTWLGPGLHLSPFNRAVPMIPTGESFLD